MSETAKPKHSNDDTSRRAFGEKLEEFREALNVLYIKKNLSGRLKFAEKWKAPAEYIFGPDLLEIDTRGPSVEEYAVRNELEELAEDRRIELKQTLLELKEKSVDSGVLQFDYVGKIVERYGPGISRVIYADNIIERVSPGLIARYDEELKQEALKEQAERQRAEDEIRARAQGLPPPDNRPRRPQAQSAPQAAIDIPEEVRPIDSAPQSPATPPPPAVAESSPPVSVPPPSPPPAELAGEAVSSALQAPPEVSASPVVPSQPPVETPPPVVPIDQSSPVVAQTPDVPPVADVAPAQLVEGSTGDTSEGLFPKPPKGLCVSAFSRALAVTADPSSYKVM